MGVHDSTMQLKDTVQGISRLADWSHAEKIKLFAWHLHTYRNRDRFNQENIRACYDELHLEKPSSVSPYLSQLQKRNPKEVLQDSRGYYLEKRIRDGFDAKYGQRQATVQVHKLLTELSGKISSEAERLFLNEAIICFRNRAFRAAIVMVWNLTYDHLEQWILSKHLAAFNTRIPIRFPKKAGACIVKKDDFGDAFKESEVIEVCSSAGIITGNLKKILDEKLTRRNLAAHPSLIEITEVQAEDFIIDLVNNVVLKLV